jgi:hypothetical protein
MEVTLSRPREASSASRSQHFQNNFNPLLPKHLTPIFTPSATLDFGDHSVTLKSKEGLPSP